MNEQFGVSWMTLIAQIINLIFVIGFLSLPFLLWNWLKKRKAHQEQQFDAIRSDLEEIKEALKTK